MRKSAREPARKKPLYARSHYIGSVASRISHIKFSTMNNNPIIGLSYGSDNDDSVISIFIAINYNLLDIYSASNADMIRPQPYIRNTCSIMIDRYRGNKE